MAGAAGAPSHRARGACKAKSHSSQTVGPDKAPEPSPGAARGNEQAAGGDLLTPPGTQFQNRSLTLHVSAHQKLLACLLPGLSLTLFAPQLCTSQVFKSARRPTGSGLGFIISQACLARKQQVAQAAHRSALKAAQCAWETI